MKEIKTAEVRIWYNPFKKEIAVEKFGDNKEWSRLGTAASEGDIQQLLEKGVIQNIAMDLLNHLNDNYNNGTTGMHITYCGTRADYEDFDFILKQFLKNSSSSKSIELEYSADHTLPDGKLAKEAVDQAYQAVKRVLPNDENDKYKKRVKPEIKLCVLGNYSTGKSTFLNAIIGEEVLPSATNPTTAKNVTIYNDKKISLGFECDGTPMRIKWSTDYSEYQYDDGGNAKLKKFLDEKIWQETNVYRQIHGILSALNEQLDIDLGKVSTDISLHLPFAIRFSKSDEVQYVLVDTPGSNAADKNSKLHKESLQKALQDQTSALPILLVDRNSIASNDNAALQKHLASEEVQLDVPNIICVIGKADTLEKPELENDKSNSAMYALLHESGIYQILYLSSLVALGSNKHDGGFYDDTLRLKFGRFGRSFCDSKEEGYRNLEDYAVLPETLKGLQHDSDADTDLSPQSLLRRNSGMNLFVRLIENFGDKYAHYTKVGSCIEALSSAIDSAGDEQEKAHKDLLKRQDEYKAEREDTMEKIIKEIESINHDNDYTQVSKDAENEYKSQIEDFIKNLEGMVKEKWSVACDEKDKQKVKHCHEAMIQHCEKMQEETFPQIRGYYEKGLDQLAREYQNAINGIIRLNDKLTEETIQRLINTQVVPPTFTATYQKYKCEKKAFSKKFLWWGEKIEPKKYARVLKEDFETHFLHYCVNNPHNEFKERFDEWCERMRSEYVTNINEKSIDLKEWDNKIAECTCKLDKIKKDIELLQKTKEELEALISF